MMMMMLLNTNIFKFLKVTSESSEADSSLIVGQLNTDLIFIKNVILVTF